MESLPSVGTGGDRHERLDELMRCSLRPNMSAESLSRGYTCSGASQRNMKRVVRRVGVTITAFWISCFLISAGF